LSAIHLACACFVTILFVSLPNSEVEQEHIGNYIVCLSKMNQTWNRRN